MIDLSNKKVLFWDFGLFTEVCNRLGRDFSKAYYFVPWADAFPKAIKSIIGQGFENMERVRYFWDYVDKVDLICLPDTHCSDLYQFLKDYGYPVAGVGEAEILELDRVKGRETQKEVGLPTQKTENIEGLTNLDEHLKEAGPCVIKLSVFRGDVETWSQDSYEDSEPKIAKLKIEWGPKGEELTFVVEQKLDGIESGLDNILYKGEVISPTILAFEIKGAGYIAKVVDYKDIPKSIKDVNDKLAPVLKKMNYNFWQSTEVIVEKDKQGYLIDPCHRLAAPCINAVQQELIENYSEQWWNMGHGIKPNPKYKAKFGGGAAFYSEWVENGNWSRIKIDPKDRDFIKFREAAKIGKDWWILPKASTCCSIVGIGNSVDEVIKKVQDISKRVSMPGSSMDKSSADFVDIKTELDECKKFGINF